MEDLGLNGERMEENQVNTEKWRVSEVPEVHGDG